jgi:hypothetical protein
LRARARVVGRNAAGWAGLWLRVDRTSKQPGFFDNMQGRPIRDSDWHEYVIEGPVADDASSLAFGAIASGDQSAEFDSFELAELTQGTWTTIGIRNGDFEEGTGSHVPGWQRVGTAAVAETIVEAVAGSDGQRVLLLRSAIGAPASNLTGAAPENAHVDLDLGSGLRARVRLSLTDSEARTEHQGLAGLHEGLASTSDPYGRSDLDVRLADVVVAWNALRHFYPYWEESKVDWDLRLRGQLALAAAAADRRAHRDALRVLVADARDGHGRVVDSASRERQGLLPIQITAVDGRLAIGASVVPDEAPVGALVTSLDQRPVSEVFNDGLRLNSGTTQWREWATLRDLIGCASGSTVAVGVELADGRTRDVRLPCTATVAAPEPRPEPIAQIAPGYWYVDLTRVTGERLTPVLQTLAAARGLVFDVRGYPTDAGFFILPYLVQKPETARWMHIPDIVGPFGRIEGWQSAGWNLQPATPHLAAPRVFLTDGRAISYAESVMGYVSALDLATIVGSTTAGANGNVTSFTVPGGFTINFTGMRVTGHDGRSPFHLVGVTPDIPTRPTLAGLRAGRDELLERALEVLGAR